MKTRTTLSEKQEQQACLDLLSRIGFTVFRSNTGAVKIENRDGSSRFIRFNEPGYPDISGYTNFGQAIFWEVKREGGKPTDKQTEFIKNAKDNDCIAGIGTYKDLEEMMRYYGFIK
jgi:hypothetical protein|tara:strand:+ start:364 stop:711 length:348 start_codon:yes stop_codon:yes gene_type:complete